MLEQKLTGHFTDEACRLTVLLLSTHLLKCFRPSQASMPSRQALHDMSLFDFCLRQRYRGAKSASIRVDQARISKLMLLLRAREA